MPGFPFTKQIFTMLTIVIALGTRGSISKYR